jgi:hypothetical protein
MMLQLTAAVQGQVFAADVVDDPAQLPDPSRPFSAYTVGQTVSAKVRHRAHTQAC